MGPNKFNYPKVRRDDTIKENFHGEEITDHYRWLEDPHSEETKKFVDEQNDLCLEHFAKCELRSKIRDRITELWDYPKTGCPSKQDNYYTFFKNTGLQNQSVMFVQKTLESEAVEFLNPNKLSDDGTTALQQYAFTEDGSLLAYQFAEKGSDWGKIKFKRVGVDGNENIDLDDLITNVKFSCLTWTHDNKGVFYNSFPNSANTEGSATEKNQYQQLMYHRIGTKQSNDIVCARFPDEPEWMGHADISDCGNYVLMTINNSCEPVNQLWYYDLRKSEVEGQGELTADLPWIKLVENFKAKYSCVANHGSKFIFKTNLGAQNYKLVSIDLSEGEKPEWKEFMAESENVLQYVAAVNKTKLLVNYMRDCKDELYLYDLETGKQLKKFALEIGTILELSCRKKDDSFFFKFGSFTTPGDIYSFQFDSNNDSHGVKTEPILYKRSEFKGLDLSVFKTEQVFFDSKDGTKVPMFIVSKKEAHKSADTPAFLYAYGGFNISLTPTFSVIRLIWLQHLNGIYVCANIRGGGEYGEKWYDAGRLENKQNCFDDFIAAGDFLTENKYTSKEKLVINGGSNGGLLVTAVINQRPDLCQLAIADVAVCDMLRFHKFTIGAYWVSDFGCADNVKQFKDMIKYSPLHTVKKDTTYPYVLLATADHDDRVVPSHSFKYISELQHHNGHTSRPYLIRIDKKSGHGAGKPTTKIIEEFGDKYAYIAHVLGLKWQD